ncbi:hypothetical protein FGO68_gene12053 [Halteria grandinella]|uniref:Uncharacterized protein n=1 Tax=Halteria grandinella TaxID=5974 RepID=A0A8J8NH54_HALGN|nr:hypothetical protein FGO68_gene12053 [Halteria grandinella]
MVIEFKLYLKGWTIIDTPGVYSDCGGTRLLGGTTAFGATAKLMNYFSLPPHYSMIISFKFWKYPLYNNNRIDSWEDEYFYYYIDQYITKTRSFNSTVYPTSSFLCGTTGMPDEILDIRVQLDHNYRSTIIYMTSNLDYPPSDVIFNQSRNHGVLPIFRCICFYVQPAALLVIRQIHKNVIYIF